MLYLCVAQLAAMFTRFGSVEEWVQEPPRPPIHNTLMHERLEFDWRVFYALTRQYNSVWGHTTQPLTWWCSLCGLDGELINHWRGRISFIVRFDDIQMVTGKVDIDTSEQYLCLMEFIMRSFASLQAVRQ